MASCVRSQPSALSLATRSLPVSAQRARLALSPARPVPCDLPSIDFARPDPRFPRPRFPALSAPAHTHPLTVSTHYRPTSVPHACSESRRPAPTLCGIVECHWIISPARALSRCEDLLYATVLYAPLRMYAMLYIALRSHSRSSCTYRLQHIVQGAHRRCPTLELVHGADRTLDTMSTHVRSRCMCASSAPPLSVRRLPLRLRCPLVHAPLAWSAQPLPQRLYCILFSNQVRLQPGPMRMASTVIDFQIPLPQICARPNQNRPWQPLRPYSASPEHSSTARTDSPAMRRRLSGASRVVYPAHTCRHDLDFAHRRRARFLCECDVSVPLTSGHAPCAKYIISRAPRLSRYLQPLNPTWTLPGDLTAVSRRFQVRATGFSRDDLAVSRKRAHHQNAISRISRRTRANLLCLTPHAVGTNVTPSAPTSQARRPRTPHLWAAYPVSRGRPRRHQGRTTSSVARARCRNAPPPRQHSGPAALSPPLRARFSPQASTLTTPRSTPRGAPSRRVPQRSVKKKAARTIATQTPDRACGATTPRRGAAPSDTGALRTQLCALETHRAAHEGRAARYRGRGADSGGSRHPPRGTRNGSNVDRCTYASGAMRRRIRRAARGAWRALGVACGTLRVVWVPGRARSCARRRGRLGARERRGRRDTPSSTSQSPRDLRAPRYVAAEGGAHRRHRR